MSTDPNAFPELTAAEVNEPVPLPPLTAGPGDALMIARTAAKHLEDVKQYDPGNRSQVERGMLKLKVAVDHWLSLSGLMPLEIQEG